MERVHQTRRRVAQGLEAAPEMAVRQDAPLVEEEGEEELPLEEKDVVEALPPRHLFSHMHKM